MGYVQQVGTPLELYDTPANVFVASFISLPPMNFFNGHVVNGTVNCGGFEYPLSQHEKDLLSVYEGKEIIFGFRPEHIELGKADGAYQLETVVELTEMLGDNTNVYITAGEDKAILKVDPHDTPEIDEKITFSIPVENVYLFDGETEMVIK
jgi:multiple sugar transport system ATP-binding protein